MSTRTAEELIVGVPKNGRQISRAARAPHDGKDLLAVRVWARPVTAEGDRAPAKKSLTLRPET